MTTTEKIRKLSRHELVPLSSRWPTYKLLGRIVYAKEMMELFAIPARVMPWVFGDPGDWILVDKLTGDASILDPEAAALLVPF